MKNKGTVQLETERLLLRKGSIKDSKEIYNNYGKDPLVSKYVVWNMHKSVAEAKALMEKWEETMRIMGYRYVMTSTQADEDAWRFYETNKIS